MTTGHPWFKMYPSDWRSEAALRNCSIAARGLWFEMLCLMHDASHRGYLVVNALPMNDTQISVQAGVPLLLVPDLVRELEEQGVFSRTRSGVIYSRRMVRDEIKSKKAQKNGKKGGNPTLGNHKENSGPLNLSDKPEVKLRSQKPDIRDKIQPPLPDPPREKPSAKPLGTSPGAELTARLCAMANLTAPPGDLDVGKRLLADGFDPERDIFPIVEAKVAEMMARGTPIRSLKLVEMCVREAVSARKTADDNEIARLKRISSDLPLPSDQELEARRRMARLSGRPDQQEAA